MSRPGQGRAAPPGTPLRPADEHRPGSRYRRSVTALTVLFGAILVLWAVLTPGFRAPDEPQHFNSVMRLATGGGWPAPGSALVSDATLIATREAGFTRPDQAIWLRTSSLLPRGILEGFGLEFVEIVPIEPAERSVLDHRADLQDEVAATVDQMTQHPPLGYALSALVVRAAGALDWRWDQQLLLLRLLDCAIAVWTLPLVAATARRLTGSTDVALVAAAALVGIGQFAHIASSVTNDSLTFVIGAALCYLAARALAGPDGNLRLAVTTGAVLGLGLLTKGFILPAIPVVALAFALPGTRGGPAGAAVTGGRRWAAAALALVVAFAVGGWWWLRNLLVHGALQPGGMPPNPETGDPTRTLGEFVPEAIARLNGSFFGNFGWLEMPLPGPLRVAMGTVLGLLVLVSLLARTPSRRDVVVLMIFPAGALAVVLLGAYRAYLDEGWFPGLQGRYIFPSIAVLLTAAALGAATLTRRVSAHRLRQLPAVTLVVALGSAAYAALHVLQAVYQAWDESLLDALVRWDAWSLLPRPVLALVVLAPVLAAVPALVTTAAAGRRTGFTDLAGPRRRGRSR